MKINATTVLVLVVVFFVGWQMSASREPTPPGPFANRPGLRWIARTAKSLLWVMAFAEPKPEIPQRSEAEQKREDAEEAMRLVNAPPGDVSRKVDWSEGY